MTINDHGFHRKIPRIRDEVDRMIIREIAVAGRETSRRAKSFVAVDHGNLKTSIRNDTKDMTSVVGTNVIYGPFVEFGTGSKVNVPNELRDYAIQFRGAGIREVNTRAQPYLYPAFFLQRDKLNRQIAKKTDDIFKRNS